MAYHDSHRQAGMRPEPRSRHGFPLARRTLLGALGAAFTLPAAKLAGTIPAAAAQEVGADGPDFSAVTTRAAARRLVRQGRLVEITLFPVELGGPDDAPNRSYTTPEAAQARAAAIATLGRYVEEDVVDQLDVAPDYKGDSIVPSRITLTGSHSRREGRFRTTIAVW